MNDEFRHITPDTTGERDHQLADNRDRAEAILLISAMEAIAAPTSDEQAPDRLIAALQRRFPLRRGCLCDVPADRQSQRHALFGDCDWPEASSHQDAAALRGLRLRVVESTRPGWTAFPNTGCVCLVVPVISPESEVLGTLEFIADHERVLDSDELDTLTLIGRMLGLRPACQKAVSRLAHQARLTLLGEMASALVHEIAQPVGAISNYQAAAKRMLADGLTESAAEALTEIGEQTERARELLQRIREFARPNMHRSDRIDPMTLITQARQLLDPLAARHGIELTTDYQGDAVEVIGDPVQFQQVIVNLVVNAVEAIARAHQSEGRVAISVTGRSNEVVIDVTDNGCGIPPSLQSRLFEPYCSGKPDGMGLGLSICHTIVKNHGGRISVENRDPLGTRFEVRLPAAS